MLRSLKTLLDPHLEVCAMTDNVLSLIDSIVALEPELAIVHTTKPDREHISMTRHIQSRFPKLKMIVVSDCTDSVIVCDVLDQGVHGFVFQQKAKAELILAVRKVLQGGTYVSSIDSQEGEDRAKLQD